MFTPNACSAAATLTRQAVAPGIDPDMGAPERPATSSVLSAAALDRFENDLELFWRNNAWTDTSPRMVACGLVQLPSWPDVPVLLETPATATLFTRRHPPIERVGAAAPGWPGAAVIGRAVCLRQEDAGGCWRINDGRSLRWETVAPGLGQGESFLSALLRVWPEGAASERAPASVALLRKHIAIRLLEAASKEKRCAGSAPWLASLMTPTEPATAEPKPAPIQSTLSPHAREWFPWQGSSSALPDAASNRPTSGAIASEAEAKAAAARQAALAEVELRAGNVTRACRQLAQVRPASEVPLRLLSQVCDRAEATGRKDLAMTLVDTLWKAGGLFRPPRTRPKVGFRVTLSHMALFAPAPPGHVNHDMGALAFTPSLARAVLRIHLKEGEFKPGSLLRWRCTAECKGVVKDELRRHGLAAFPVDHHDDSPHYETLVIREIPCAGAPESPPMRESLAALRLRQIVESGIDCVVERTDAALRAMLLKTSRQLTIEQVLDIMKTTTGSKAWVYRQLADDAAVHSDAFALVQLLDAWEQELGAIGSDEWLVLMQGWTGADRWRACRRIAVQMRLRGQPVGVEHLRAMYESATARDNVLEAIDDFGTRLAQGMAPNAELIKALLRAAAMAGLPVQVQQFLKEVKAHELNHDENVRRSLVILSARTQQLTLGRLQLDQLRMDGLKPDLPTMQALVGALWKDGLRDAAADIVTASVQAGDGLYVPDLGLQRSDGSSHECLNLTASALHHRDPSLEALKCSFVSDQETLTVLHLHASSGRLRAGMQVQLPSRLVSESRRGVAVPRYFDDLLMDCLRQFGLRATPSRSRDGRWASTHVLKTLRPA